MAEKDPVTNQKAYLLRYAVAEGGTWRYVGCGSTTELYDKLVDLQANADIECIEVYGLENRYRKMPMPHWVTEV